MFVSVICLYDFDIIVLQEVGQNWKMGFVGDMIVVLVEIFGFEYYCFVFCIDEFFYFYGYVFLSKYLIFESKDVLLSKEVDEFCVFI